MAGLDLGQVLGGLLGNLGTGIENFANSSAPLPGIVNLVKGVATGQPTDAQGIAQQNLNATYQAARNQGMSHDQAVLFATNPEFQKLAISRMFPTYGVHNNGNTVLRTNSATGEVTPVYIAPEFKSAPNTDAVYSYQPALPGQQNAGPIQRQELTPPAGARGSAPLPGGTQMLQPGMSVQDKSAAEAAGKVQGQSAATLPNTLAGADQALKIIDEVQNHPGKNTSVGPFAGHIPAIVPQTQNFVAKLSELQGKTFLQAYNQLKGAGAISNTEGAKAETAIAALTRAQSVPQFDAALNDLRDVIKTGRANAIRIAKGETAPTPAEMNPPASTPSNGGWTQVTPNIRVRPK